MAKKKRKWATKMWVAALATVVTLNTGIIPASANYTTDFVHEGVGTDYGDATWKNNQILSEPVDFSQETVGQMMKAIEDFDFDQFAADHADLPWLDKLLVNEGVIPDDNNDDGSANTLFSRGSALYMKTQNNRQLGFVGTVHYADTLNKDTMYNITLSTGAVMEDKAARKNYPSHADQTYKSGGLDISQRKFITSSNTAVTLLKLTNNGNSPITLTMTVKSPFVTEAEGDELIGKRVAAPIMVGRAGEEYVEAMSHVDVHLSGDGMMPVGNDLVKEITVPAGTSVDEKVVMGWLAEEIPASKTQYAEFKASNNEKAFNDQVKEYNEWWAQNIPYIDIPDENVKKVLYYRWWSNRFNLLEANIPGNDWQFPMNMEGVLGYNNGITVSVPWVLQDLKWLRDPSYAYGTWLAQGEYSENANYKNNPGRPNIWTWDMMQNTSQVGWEAYKIYGGGEKVLKKFADFSANDVTGTLNHFRGTHPDLVYYNHGPITGNDGDTVSMHWKGNGNYARLDGSSTAYANAVATKQMYEQLGDDANAKRMEEVAQRIRTAILNNMWYDEADFDGDGEADTNGEGSFLHKKVINQQDVFNPWRDNNMFVFNFGVVPKEGEAGYKSKYLTQLSDYGDPNYYPIFPFFTADQHSIMKRVEAFRNGETSAFGTDQFAWCNFGNYINTIRASLRHYPVENINTDTYKTLFDWGAWLHTVEPGNTDHLDSNEFFWLEDYFFGTPWTPQNPPNPSGKMVRAWIHHDTLGMMNYSVMEDMAGLQPRADDKIELWPLDIQYDHFAVDNVRYHDANLSIVWQDPAKYTDSNPYYKDIPVGYSLFINGERVMTTDEMSHIIFDTATGKVEKPDGDVPGAVGDNTNTNVIYEIGRAVNLASADDTSLAGNEKAVDMFNKAGVDVEHSGVNLATTAGTTVESSYINSNSNVNRLADGSTIASITHTSNTALFGGSPNPSDSVTFQFDGVQTVDNVKVYFYNDRRPNGYAAPQTFGVEYLDADGTTWKPVEGQFRYPNYVAANYNNVEFSAVNTKAIRVHFTHASAYSTGIKEIQIYNNDLNVTPSENLAPKVQLDLPVNVEQGAPLKLAPVITDDGLPSGRLTYAWNLVSGDAGAVQAEALDQATLNVTFGAVGEYVYELSVSDGEEVTKVEVPITVYVATAELSNVIAKFADRVSPQGKLVRNADDFTPESWQTLQAALTEAKELLARDDYSLDDVQSMTNRVRVAEESLRYRNAALLATPSASYTSAWESLNSVNDGYIPLVPGSIGNPEIETQYGNWGSPNQSHWVEYTWKTPVTLSGSSIYFYDDGGGVQVPADYDFEYWDQETGEYVAVSGLSEKKMEKGKFNQVTFNEVTTDKLRLMMKNQSSSVYTGLKEWRAISAKPEGEEPPQTDHGLITAIEPASVNTTINVMPELPSQVTVTFEDKTKGLANVVWDEIPENKLSIATDFVVLGSVEGTDLRASLRIYVKYDKSRLKAAIDAASDPSVNEENYVGTPEQWQTLQTALQLANEVYNNDASTEGDIDSAYKALLEAFEALEPVEEHNVTIIGINIPGGSVDQLAKEIVIPEATTLEELKTGLNVPASVTFAVYESDGLTSAIDLKTGYKVTLTGSDQITTKTYTVLKVTENPPVNTAALQAKLNEVRALKQERYTAASWQNLMEKISTAEQLLTSGSASQADIDAAVIALDSAIAGLKLLPTPTPAPSPSPSAPTPVPAPAPTPTDTKELTPITVSQGRIEVKAAATGKDGKVKVLLRDSDMQAALEDMKDGKLTIVIQKDSEIQQVEALLPWKTLSTTKSLTSVKIETGSTVLTIPHQFLTAIRDITNLGVVFEAVEPSQLPKQAGKFLEADLVSNITVNADGKSLSSKELHGKGLRLAMPYQLKEGIKGHQVVAFTLNDAGVAHAIVGGRFDESTKMFEFNMEQNGMFGVLGVNIAFKDLNNVNWALEGIEALAARGAIEGTGAGEFNPTSQVTRAEFLKTLMNSFDLLDESAKPSFSDVKEGTWYSTPIASAHKLGIVKGKANGTFGPNEPITREEMAVMIYRLAGNLNVTLSTEEVDDSAKFVDLENLSSESSSAVEAVRKGGLITGMPDGRFIPNGQTTRAQAVTVIYRLLTNLEK